MYSFRILVYFPTAACLIAVNYTGCEQITVSIVIMIMAYVFLAMNQGEIAMEPFSFAYFFGFLYFVSFCLNPKSRGKNK